MNRRQLDALLAAGAITGEQHKAALASIDSTGTVTALPSIQMQVAAQTRLDVAPDEEQTWDGIIGGDITAYGVLIPSHGMILEAGCMEPRQPLDRVKMMRDHDHAQPLGYMLSIDSAAVHAEFQIAEPERARVLQEVRDKLRDGISVGFTILEYSFDEDWILHVARADLYEASLCAVPAVSGAGVTNVAAALAANRKENTTMNRAQLAAALAAGTITQEQHDTALGVLEATELAAPGTPAPAPVAPEVARGPELHTAQTPVPTVADRSLSLREVTRRVAAAANTGDTRQVALALADIIPANDAGEGYANRPEWLDALFTATQETRPYIDAIGAPLPLAALRAKGFRWGVKPAVGEYAGDKAEVPTGGVTTVGDDFVAFRIAGGWDIDRAYVDFGDEAFLADFWTHVVADYQIKSETGIRNRVKALKANSTGTVTTGGVKAVLKQVIRDGRAVTGAGVKVNRVFLSDSLFEELEDIETEKLPLWLKTATIGMEIADGSANVGDLRIGLDSTLAAGEVVAFDNRGLIVREREIPQIRAIDVAHGGIDLGFTSYLRLDDVDPRLVFRRKYVAA